MVPCGECVVTRNEEKRGLLVIMCHLHAENKYYNAVAIITLWFSVAMWLQLQTAQENQKSSQPVYFPCCEPCAIHPLYHSLQDQESLS